MTTTDANGILRWESTDSVTPLESTLNAGMDSVSAAVTLVKRGLINYVANTSARSALAATFLPTASKPLYVHRQDAPAGYNLEYTINGTTWYTVYPTKPAFTPLTLAANWVAQGSGVAPRVRVFGDIVEISGTQLARVNSGQFTSPGAGFSIATLAVGQRPSTPQYFSTSIGVGGSLGVSTIIITTDGNISCISQVGGGTIEVGGGWGNSVVLPTIRFSRS